MTHANEVRVLVVDDDPDVVRTLSLSLAMDGYEVSTAGDGRTALSTIAHVRPHCMLFDIMMPEIDGHDLARRVKQDYGDDIVLIVMTGMDGKDPRVAETFAIVDHYLIKPIDTKLLRRALPPVEA